MKKNKKKKNPNPPQLTRIKWNVGDSNNKKNINIYQKSKSLKDDN